MKRLILIICFLFSISGCNGNRTLTWLFGPILFPPQKWAQKDREEFITKTELLKQNWSQQDPNFVGPPESIEGIGQAESLKKSADETSIGGGSGTIKSFKISKVR